MIKALVFSVFDTAVSTFFPPFYAPSVRDAKDSFKHTANDPSTRVCNHPADHVLFELGTFDTQLGRFENLPAPINHGTALLYKQAPAVQPGLPLNVVSNKESETAQ